MNLRVSIITPCYNHGIYLDDCIASTRDMVQSGLAEHIIVNDGSTEEKTLKKFEELEKSGKQIIHQENMGLSAARNTGIISAKGEYVLPLDSDNMASSEYVKSAVKMLDSRNDLDIIYGDMQFIEDTNFLYKPLSFDISKILHSNYIDACAIYRKKVWKENSGYDTNMRTGYEDWEFWINAYFNGFQFYYMPLLSFHYRVRTDSMLRTISNGKEDENRRFIFKKHQDKISDQYAMLYKNFSLEKSQNNFVEKYLEKNKLKSIIKILFGKQIKL